MKLKSLFLGVAVGAVSALALAASASAAVIAGPTLNTNGSGWNDTGLEFKALNNATLTSFTFQNQGQADTIVLTDTAGNILDSVGTAAGVTSNTVNVNWALSAGQSYWLLQTTKSNELYTYFGQALPSDADIAIVQSGGFAYTISDTVNNVNGWGANQYWAAFNDITTGGGGVPEPASWAMMILGFVGLGSLLRRRSAIAAA